MKNAIQEYIPLNDAELKNLWDNAIFVFDTNVLLNLYRYSAKTREDLLNKIEAIKDRVWLPYQVVYEYAKNRCETIFESAEKYKKIDEIKSDFIKKIIEALRIKDDSDEIKNLNASIQNWLETNKKSNLLVSNPREDYIFNKLLSIFDGHVGQSWCKEVLEKESNRAKERYNTDTPPGYKDANKANKSNDNNSFGDYFIWRQIMDFSKEQDVDIIYITNDIKEDWWQRIQGKTIGPRPELLKEFFIETNHRFYMYTMERFIASYDSYNNQQTSENVKNEVNINMTLDEIANKLEEIKKRNSLINTVKKQIDSLNKELRIVDVNLTDFEDFSQKFDIDNPDYWDDWHELINRKEKLTEQINNRLKLLELIKNVEIKI